MLLATPLSRLLCAVWKIALPSSVITGLLVMSPQTVFDSSCAAATPRIAGMRVMAWRSSLMMTLRVMATTSPNVWSE